jgi:hypothetical protein
LLLIHKQLSTNKAHSPQRSRSAQAAATELSPQRTLFSAEGCEKKVNKNTVIWIGFGVRFGYSYRHPSPNPSNSTQLASPDDLSVRWTGLRSGAAVREFVIQLRGTSSPHTSQPPFASCRTLAISITLQLRDDLSPLPYRKLELSEVALGSILPTLLYGTQQILEGVPFVFKVYSAMLKTACRQECG